MQAQDGVKKSSTSPERSSPHQCEQATVTRRSPRQGAPAYTQPFPIPTNIHPRQPLHSTSSMVMLVAGAIVSTLDCVRIHFPVLPNIFRRVQGVLHLRLHERSQSMPRTTSSTIICRQIGNRVSHEPFVVPRLYTDDFERRRLGPKTQLSD